MMNIYEYNGKRIVTTKSHEEAIKHFSNIINNVEGILKEFLNEIVNGELHPREFDVMLLKQNNKGEQK